MTLAIATGILQPLVLWKGLHLKIPKHWQQGQEQEQLQQFRQQQELKQTIFCILKYFLLICFRFILGLVSLYFPALPSLVLKSCRTFVMHSIFKMRKGIKNNHKVSIFILE